VGAGSSHPGNAGAANASTGRKRAARFLLRLKKDAGTGISATSGPKKEEFLSANQEK